MSTVLYVGRIVTITNYADDPAGRNRTARVVDVGPSGRLPPGIVRVEVLEADVWRTDVREGEVVALTEAQEALREKHGLPSEFATACMNSVPGFVSYGEAYAAIRKYRAEWSAAK